MEAGKIWEGGVVSLGWIFLRLVGYFGLVVLKWYHSEVNLVRLTCEETVKSGGKGHIAENQKLVPRVESTVVPKCVLRASLKRNGLCDGKCGLVTLYISL